MDPADVTVLGRSRARVTVVIEAKPHLRKLKSLLTSPLLRRKLAKLDFQTELKSMDNKWSEHFAHLEAMFLRFSVLVEPPVQKGDVVVTDRPFIPPVQQTTGVNGQRQLTGQMEMKKATQPVEAPAVVTATQPVEAPNAVSHPAC